MNCTELAAELSTTWKFTVEVNARFPVTAIESKSVPRVPTPFEVNSHTIIELADMVRLPSTVSRPGEAPGLKVPAMLGLPLTVPEPPNV